MREILGCKANGEKFCYCCDCKYKTDEVGCRDFIRMFDAKVEFAVNKPGRRHKIELVEVPRVKA